MFHLVIYLIIEMENLTTSEKLLLQRLLKHLFHSNETLIDEKVKCWGVIMLSKKLGLEKDFIEELESIYQFEFVN